MSQEATRRSLMPLLPYLPNSIPFPIMILIALFVH